ncbi:unnamed protein product [Medioppia subpectinata]|uniref:ARC105/Med15 mediator subunit C-terminal domain-containing protein n=1 Tax=Medioppia subpectinata TaxID=1979941 RepID=A0A7R9Q5A4_9ACAR|nr:unnamed protein product [Medioppia subpectinata]CAG2113239.1 unnamed protein product [Medioppia subpectinata]
MLCNLSWGNTSLKGTDLKYILKTSLGGTLSIGNIFGTDRSFMEKLHYQNTIKTIFLRIRLSASGFFQDIQKKFDLNVDKLPQSFSVTTLLNSWELSVRQAVSSALDPICFAVFVLPNVE